MRKLTDIDILRTVAEYRLLTLPQITLLHFPSRQVTRRRLRQMKLDGLVALVPHGLNGSRGRPESVVSLAETGVRHLRTEGLLPPKLPSDQVAADDIRCVEHHLLVNWFLLHLRHVPAACPHLATQLLTPTSPFDLRADGTPLVHDLIPAKDTEQQDDWFTPDAAFSLTDTASQRGLLFFLEVDRATESLGSGKDDGRDIRQKIVNYRRFLRGSVPS